jgi:hypothetical protein
LLFAVRIAAIIISIIRTSEATTAAPSLFTSGFNYLKTQKTNCSEHGKVHHYPELLI